MKRIVWIVVWFAGTIAGCGNDTENSPMLPDSTPTIEPPPSPISNPNPTSEPSPEPTLHQFTCDEFLPPLLEPRPAEEIAITLTENEATYIWYTPSLDSPLSYDYDPEGPLGCEHLLAGDRNFGFYQYISIFKLPTSELPTAEEAENVYLYLYPEEIDYPIAFDIYTKVLESDWWLDCWTNPNDWRSLLEEEGPVTGPRAAIWDRWDDGTNEHHWVRLELTEHYRDWQNGLRPNYGFIVGGPIYNLTVFAGAGHPNENLRPRLTITTAPRPATLFFPLAGGYADSHVNSPFGVWWKKKRCLPINGAPGPKLRHTGVDYAAAARDQVYAVADGVIKYARSDSTWGGYVVIEHDQNWTSCCTHVYPVVNEGKEVKRGELIATIASGNVNFDPHLHFQVLNEPYGDGIGARRGRLPNEESCTVVDSPYSQPEPAFPESFIDPECLDWE